MQSPKGREKVVMAHLRGEKYQDIMLVQETNKEPKRKGFEEIVKDVIG